MKITNHGEERIRKRTGVPRKAVDRMAKRALIEGVGRCKFSGSLRRYLDGMYHAYDESANNIKVWGEKVWIFNGDVLITVMDLPQRYKKSANGKVKKDED